MELRGKFGTAQVFTDEIESEAISQIINILNQPWSKDSNMRIMPDVHVGSGCVVGYTAKLTDKVVPNLISVDIGCGVLAYHLGHKSIIGEKFDKLDKFIRSNIPAGAGTNDFPDEEELEETFKSFYKFDSIRHFKDYRESLTEIASRMQLEKKYILCSIGSLGGGNHFIEIDETEHGELYLVIHTGSRGFGKGVAEFHQRVARHATLLVPQETFDAELERIKKVKKGKGVQVAIDAYRKEVTIKLPHDLEYLSGETAEAYYADMKIAQVYAMLNRRVMVKRIVEGFYRQKYDEKMSIESVHNYINFEDGIVRKGAISAHDGEVVIIPLNMAKGCVLGIGKGNEEFNNSGPHGAGRKMSRAKAKSTIDLKDYQFKMKQAGVWSTSVNKETIDESPQAYKNVDKIIELLEPTVEVVSRMKSIYNFKAGE